MYHPTATKIDRANDYAHAQFGRNGPIDDATPEPAGEPWLSYTDESGERQTTTVTALLHMAEYAQPMSGACYIHGCPYIHDADA